MATLGLASMNEGLLWIRRIHILESPMAASALKESKSLLALVAVYIACRGPTLVHYKVSPDNEPHGKASRKIKILAFRHCYHTTQSYFEK